MKIAMIGQRGIPAEGGGIDTAVEQLSLRLAEKGHSVTVFCRYRDRMAKAAAFDNLQLKYLPSLKSRVLETLSHSFICSVYASFNNYDIVHFHGMGSALFSVVPRFLLKKTVVSIQGLDWKRKKWGRFIKIGLKLCEWAALNFPNKTTVVSKTLQGYYLDKYGKELAYIPNGADNYGLKEGISSKTLDDLGLKENEYVLFLGRLVPEKGCHYLIKSFRQVKTDKKLVVTGGSSYTDRHVRDLKKMAAGDDRVVFTGPLYSSAKRNLLKGAYIFVLPSEIEGLSISLLEAMNYKKCVLVSDIPENIEAIGDCGFSFRNKDENDLREKLRYLLPNRNIVKDMGQRARSRVLTDYNWQEIAGRVEQSYEKIY